MELLTNKKDNFLNTSNFRLILIKSDIENVEYEYLSQICKNKKIKNNYLTEYEYEILDKISQNVDFATISERFGLSRCCLKTQLALILEKMGIKNVEYLLVKTLIENN